MSLFQTIGKYLTMFINMGQLPNGKYAPMQMNENGELKVDTEISITGDVNVNNVKVGSSDGGTTQVFLKTEADGTLIEKNSTTINASLNTLKATDFALSAKQLPDNHQVTVSNMIAEIETGLSKEITSESILIQLGNIKAKIEKCDTSNIDGNINISNQLDISGLSTEATSDSILTETENINTKLEELKQGLTATNFNVNILNPTNISTLATETTLSAISTAQTDGTQITDIKQKILNSFDTIITTDKAYGIDIGIEEFDLDAAPIIPAGIDGSYTDKIIFVFNNFPKSGEPVLITACKGGATETNYFIQMVQSDGSVGFITLNDKCKVFGQNIIDYSIFEEAEIYLYRMKDRAGLIESHNINEKLEQIRQGLTATNFNVNLDFSPLAKETTATSILIQTGNVNSTQIQIKNVLDEIKEKQTQILSQIKKNEKDNLLNAIDCKIHLVEKNSEHKIFSYASASLSLNYRKTVYLDEGDYAGESWKKI